MIIITSGNEIQIPSENDFFSVTLNINLLRLPDPNNKELYSKYYYGSSDIHNF